MAVHEGRVDVNPRTGEFHVGLWRVEHQLLRLSSDRQSWQKRDGLLRPARLLRQPPLS